MRLQLCVFYAPRGIDPNRIINATSAELEFFSLSRDRYFEDSKIIIQNAVVEVVNQIEEARQNG